MALTETPPREAEAVVPPYEAPPAPARGLASVVGTSDHKVVGRLFMGTAFLFGLAAAGGGQLVAIDRIDGTTGNTILNHDTFFQVFTLQAVAGTLLFALPLLIGLGLLVVPLQIGAKTVAFPRAAAAAYWSFLISGCLVVASYAMNGGPGGGSSTGVDLWALAMLGVVASLLLATLCLVTTVLGLRAPGMTLDRTPLFSWSMLAAGGVWLLSLPVLAASLLLVYTGHRFAGRSFAFSSNDAVFLRIRWVLSQPQLYAFAAPVLGIAADVVVTAVRRPQILHRTAMAAIGAFAVLGFGGYVATFDNPKVLTEPVFVVVAFGAVIPLLLFGGLLADTLRRGSVRLTGPLAFAGVAYLMLLAGVLAGAAVAVDAFDLQGTVWNTAVTNYVVLAAVIGALGGLHHWATKIVGRPLSEPVGYLAALALLGGTVLTCFPDLISGAFGNRTDKVKGIEALNAIAAIGTAVVILGALLAVANVLAGLRRRSGKDDEGEPDPWVGGLTLEWATKSPPPPDNFDVVLPEVTSEAPLLDARRADETQSDVTEGAGV